MQEKTVSVRALRRALLLSPKFCPTFKAVGDIPVPDGVGGRSRSIWRDVVISVVTGDEDFAVALRREREHMAKNGASDRLIGEVCDLLQSEFAAANDLVDDLLKEVARHEVAAE